MTTTCRELTDQIVDLVEGLLDVETERRLRAHATACAACRRELLLEERLVRELRSWPPAPAIRIPEPDPEGPRVLPRRPVPVRVLAAAAGLAAAAALLAGVVWSGALEPPATEPLAPARLGADAGRDDPAAPRSVEIRTVRDSSADAPLPDDGLLALTAGVEAVVMRRPVLGHSLRER